MQIVTFKAARDIEVGEELTFYYGDNLWFEDASASTPRRESKHHDHMDREDLFLGSMRL